MGKRCDRAPALISEQAAAAELAVSIATIRRWRKAGTIGGARKLPSGSVRYCPVELRRWRDAHRVG